MTSGTLEIFALIVDPVCRCVDGGGVRASDEHYLRGVQRKCCGCVGVVLVLAQLEVFCAVPSVEVLESWVCIVWHKSTQRGSQDARTPFSDVESCTA